MVAIAATCAFFPPASLASDSRAKPAPKLLTCGRMKSKSAEASGGFPVKVNADASTKINGTEVGFATPGLEGVKNDGNASSPLLETSLKTIPDQKQWTIPYWQPMQSDMDMDLFRSGRLDQNGLVFRQNFSIRSYEVVADRTSSLETLMNHLQEASFNHGKSLGLVGEGFGATPGISKKINLMWAVKRTQVVVDHYPSCRGRGRITPGKIVVQQPTCESKGKSIASSQIMKLIEESMDSDDDRDDDGHDRGDVVQIEGWFHLSGRNGLRRDVFFRDCKTGETLAKAYILYVLVNNQTRQLSKIPEKLRLELEPCFWDSYSIAEEDSRKLQEPGQNEADFVRAGFTTRWNDLDANQHVNNVKYVGWILESAPVKIMESHEVSTMTLEYKRECRKDSVLQLLTAVSRNSVVNLGNLAVIDCQHLLGLEDGEEILRGRTVWRPKYADNSVAVGQTQIPSECT
ncbi:Palmitoyl-acyl carrier protein thioesterase, chloroplastic [Morella rubra]|uniref:Acyl-[acyl-carrier-protein] hydrolase n=1 Tax=Morella rubra TaxID=262757 RepID=A0A6A1UHX7_9ROSI|nr:Palmitoyl-acyl carrier protein thioesterase, chloroplastic [Morella rubra]